MRSTNVNAVDDIGMWPFWITASWLQSLLVESLISGGRMKPAWAFGHKGRERGRPPKKAESSDIPWT